MSYLIEVLTVYQGIIGAIGGVIATLVVTHLLKNVGRVYIYSNNHKFEFLKRDEAGGLVTTTSAEAEYGNLNFGLWILNSSEIPRSFRDIFIGFYDSDNRLIFKDVPQDEKTRRVAAATVWRDELVLINLPPKEMVYFQLWTSIPEDGLKRIDECAYINFEAKNHRGKTIKRLIKRLN